MASEREMLGIQGGLLWQNDDGEEYGGTSCKTGGEGGRAHASSDNATAEASTT